MKTVSVAAIAALALMGTALSASAATMNNLGTLVDGDGPNIGTGKASKGTIDDTYTFMLDGGSTSFSVQPSIVLSVVAPKGVTPSATVSNFTLSLFAKGNATAIDSTTIALASKGADLALTDDGLLPDTSYSLVVTGTVNPVNGQTVSYGGSMPVIGVSAVPLPTSVALFGTAIMGFGVAGAVRKKTKSAVA